MRQVEEVEEEKRTEKKSLGVTSRFLTNTHTFTIKSFKNMCWHTSTMGRCKSASNRPKLTDRNSLSWNLSTPLSIINLSFSYEAECNTLFFMSHFLRHLIQSFGIEILCKKRNSSTFPDSFHWWIVEGAGAFKLCFKNLIMNIGQYFSNQYVEFICWNNIEHTILKVTNFWA